jgi:hypothetical protein
MRVISRLLLFVTEDYAENKQQNQRKTLILARISGFFSNNRTNLARFCGKRRFAAGGQFQTATLSARGSNRTK